MVHTLELGWCVLFGMIRGHKVRKENVVVKNIVVSLFMLYYPDSARILQGFFSCCKIYKTRFNSASF